MPVVSADTALRHLREGDAVLVTMPDEAHAKEGPKYTLLSGKGTLQGRTFRKLEPQLQAAGDGLFEDSPSQTYRLAP